MRLITKLKSNYKVFRNLYLKIKMRKKKPIFIVGCGHSGTSLMYSILDHHKHLYSERYETGIFLQKKINFNEIEGMLKNAGKKRLVEKTPSHVTVISKIFKVFPSAKIIVMLRDGRDVACSIKERSGNFKEGVNRWIEDNTAWKDFVDNKNIYIQKLEDLTQNPEIELKKLFKFLNIQYYDNILNYHKQKRDFFTNINRQKHEINRSSQINKPIIKDTSRWQKEMSSKEIHYFKANANKMLVDFGYAKDDKW